MSTITVKMLCTFEYNPETNEYKPIGQPEIIKSTKPKKEESNEPQLELEENKYHLNSKAVELLNVSAGDKIDIKYQIIGNVNYPVIGKSTVWNSNSGNKLTKSNTVSFRGKANVLLSEFGQTFTFTPWINHDNLFVLIGDEPIPELVEDNNIEVPTDTEIEEDLPSENLPIEDDFSDIDDLLEEDDYEIKNFKFKF